MRGERTTGAGNELTGAPAQAGRLRKAISTPLASERSSKSRASPRGPMSALRCGYWQRFT
jgi:hypothetical protein